MSISNNPETHNSLFEKREGNVDVPPTLARATLRLEFPPSYVIVGVYRLCTDKLLYKPAWDKCKHATRRGLIVGSIWAVLSFTIQKEIITVFLSNSPRVSGLSHETVFGYKPPFSLPTYAALIFLGQQITFILKFFLSKNIRIARDRAWDQTVASRGKGLEFWQPYVEEWKVPPPINSDSFGTKSVKKLLGGPLGLLFVKRVLLLPFNFYPFIGVAISACFKAVGTARYLHRQYFSAKKMSEYQTAVFVEERKWDYRLFGFAAALLESIPIIGLVFTISNRVGAAMWAFDLEKRQHYFSEQKSD